MPDFNPFDMDFDGDVDGIDFLGFDYLARRVLQPDRDEEADDGWDGEDAADDDEWHDEHETENDYEESEIDEDDDDSGEDEMSDDL
ncbi:MAG TPA: hypothetical protein VM075_00970 [Anaerolineae bacterium]|nr:hypothetical protein [Anaerolineae bacterium]